MKRTEEKKKEIVERIKIILKDKNLNQKQLESITGIQQNAISKYLSGENPIADGFIYTLVYKLFISPQYLEDGIEPMYLSPNVAQSNENNGNGTQINNINGDNNVNMTMPKETWDMLQSQQKTIESQQDSVKMAQVNMMEIIKAFNK